MRSSHGGKKLHLKLPRSKERPTYAEKIRRVTNRGGKKKEMKKTLLVDEIRPFGVACIASNLAG